MLSGKTIVIVYLIPEPELYLYLTLALVLDSLGTQLTMFLEFPYLEGYKITYEGCYATF